MRKYIQLLYSIKNASRRRLGALIFASVLLLSFGIPAGSASAQVSGPVSSTGTVNSTSTSTNTNIVLNNVQSTSGAASSSNQITLSNFNANTGNNRLLLVGVSANNNSVTSITFGEIPLIRAVSTFHNNDAEFWYLVNPSGTANITVTMTGPTDAVVGAYGFSGTDQENPIATTATNYTTVNSSPTISLNTKYPNDWVLDLPSIYGGVTLGAHTCTQEWNDQVPNAITGASSSIEITFPAVVTCNWVASGSGDLWDDAAVELKSYGSSIFDITDGLSTNPTQPNAVTKSVGITVYAHRIPAPYWAPCFATTCSAGTGPGATMYFELYDSSGNIVKSGYADENGYTFLGLNPLVTYYVYPDDCDNCHGSSHDVVFQYWGDNYSAERPRAATVGTSLDAWYSCTNNCAGGP
jgi:hypothetical protein